MTYTATGIAAALLSPLTFSSPFSPTLLPRARDICARVVEAVLARAPSGRGCVPSSWVKARDFHDARRTFDEIPKRSAPAWTATISGCARASRHADGMRAFGEMLAEGVAAPNAFVLAGVLRCCAGLGDVESGVLCNAVLGMYAKCGPYDRAKEAFGVMAERDAVSCNIVISSCLQNVNVLRAMQLFDESPLRDASSWNTIISGLMQNGCAAEALDRLHQMARAGFVFN